MHTIQFIRLTVAHVYITRNWISMLIQFTFTQVDIERRR